MADIPLAGRQVTEAFDAVGGAIGNLGRAMQDRELLAQDIIEYLSQEHLFGEKEWFGGWDDFTLNQVNEAEGHTVTVTKGGKKYQLRAGEKFADWRRNDKPVPSTSSPMPASSPAPALAPASVAQPVDFNDPSTWKTVGPDKVDVGRPLPVSEAQAATLKYGKYRDAAHRASETVDASGNRLRNQTLANIESEMSGFHTGSAINLGYEGRAIAKLEFQKNYQDVMSKIYKDISEGIDPMTALRNHINDYDIPDDIRETIVKRVQEAELNAGKTGEVTMTPYRQLTEDEYVSRMNDTRRATASESTINSYGDDLIEPKITTRVSDPSGEEYRAARARGERIVTEPYSHAEAVATSSVDDVARPGPGLKVGETVDLPVVYSARDTAEKLSATARVADAVASDGGPAKAAAAVASAAADVVAGPTAPASARAVSSTASSLAAGSNLSKMVTKGPAGAIALGVAAAGLLIGKSVQSNKRADRSAQMNVQQRYGR